MWRCLGLAAAIAIAITTQALLLHGSIDSHLEAAPILYAVAVALALISAGASEERQGPPPPDPPPSPWADWSAAGLALALICTLSAALLSLAAPHSPLPVALWIVGLALLVPAFAGKEGGHFRLLPRREMALLGAILLVGFAARVYSLETLPAVFHGDEAQSGLQARDFLAGRDDGFFTVGWYNLPIFSFALQGLVMQAAGDDVFGLRFASVICGTLALLFTCLLARLLFRPPTAVIAAALAAVGYWPIHFSRIGINYIQTTLFEVMAWYFLVRGLRRRRPLDFALCGVALGLGMLSYYASRLAPVLVALVIGWYALRQRGFLRANLGNLLALLLGGLVTIGPQAAYFLLQDPEALMTRTGDVFLFNNQQHTLNSLGTADPLKLLWIQSREALLVFSYRGDTSLQFGFSEPHLDFVTAALFLLGVAITLRRVWRWPYGFLHFWLWVTLFVGCVLTIDAPFGPRLVGAIPAPFMLAALPLAELYNCLRREFPRRGKALVGGLLACALVVGYLNYDAYVNRFNGIERPTNDVMELVRALTALKDRRVYLFATPEQSLGYGTVRFIARDTEGYNVADPTAVVPLRGELDKDVAFLFWPSQLDRLAYVQHFYPEGLLARQRNHLGKVILYHYLVGREEILADQGLVALYYPADRRDGEPLARVAGVTPGSLPPAGLTCPLDAVWRGTLHVPDYSTYTLALSGPESGLWLDGQQILHSGDTKAATLAQGPHSLEIRAALLDCREQVGFYWAVGSGRLVPVPRSALSVEPEAHGLLGAYEERPSNPAPDRGPVGVTSPGSFQVDPLVAFRELKPWQEGSFAVEWSGCLRVPVGGLYSFRVTSRDGAHLFLDGRELISDDHHRAIRSAQGQVYLSQGSHTLLLRGSFDKGQRWMELHWRPPGGFWSLVPTESLTPYLPCPSGSE